MSFRYVDLFAGIGGFHAALSALGGQCVMASEIDENARKIYQRNWGMSVHGDITQLANEKFVDIPDHDVLVGGFPCQPFSKSGLQKGMDESRGTLFWNIARIIETKKPKIVILENVRNLAGPRHAHEWEVIIRTLREQGYRVSSKPFIVSPHKIRPEFGGRPQVRERVLICATLKPKGYSEFEIEPGLPDMQALYAGWNSDKWKLEKHLPLEKITKKALKEKLALSENQNAWIEAWDEFVFIIKGRTGGILPGFPIWADEWIDFEELRIPRKTPEWKAEFLRKNSQFYTEHKKVLDKWLKKWNKLENFPPSRRKLEWQAQDNGSLWDGILHFRPSGIRAKKANYVPALVAMNQTSIIGKQKRRLSVREGARLQGFPDWFDFLDQPDSVSFKQLGNAVNVAVIYQAMKALVARDINILAKEIPLISSIISAGPNPDLVLDKSREFFGAEANKNTANLDLPIQLKLII
jgi:DNA (cytosine-5)-methyltransferase 1